MANGFYIACWICDARNGIPCMQTGKIIMNEPLKFASSDNQSRISTTVIIIFYTCVWIPFCQLKRSLIDIAEAIYLYVCPRNMQGKGPTYQEGSCFMDLPAARFEDLNCGGGRGGDCGLVEEEEVCCVCLVEFEREDVVSQLPKCRHVFHMGCIEGWLNRNHFSCPLCRSLLLSASAPPCKSSRRH
ncbi:hypothetical protein LguiA_009194 [Lonicera macranthoides]